MISRFNLSLLDGRLTDSPGKPPGLVLATRRLFRIVVVKEEREHGNLLLADGVKLVRIETQRL